MTLYYVNQISATLAGDKGQILIVGLCKSIPAVILLVHSNRKLK